MASYFRREIFYVPFPGTPGKIPGNSGSTELRKEFGTTLVRGDARACGAISSDIDINWMLFNE